MSTTVLLGLTSFEKNWGPVDFWGASDFSNLLAPWASDSRSLMLRAVWVVLRKRAPMCDIELVALDLHICVAITG